MATGKSEATRAVYITPLPARRSRSCTRSSDLRSRWCRRHRNRSTLGLEGTPSLSRPVVFKPRQDEPEGVGTTVHVTHVGAALGSRAPPPPLPTQQTFFFFFSSRGSEVSWHWGKGCWLPSGSALFSFSILVHLFACEAIRGPEKGVAWPKPCSTSDLNSWSSPAATGHSGGGDRQTSRVTSCAPCLS